jgi:membrane protease YdiL (CAAX protease family)
LWSGKGLPWAAGGSEILGRALLIWLPTAILIIVICLITSRREHNLAHYPQIRAEDWSGGLLAVSALGWMVYLVGYEIMFRGFLLFACYDAFGYWPAILINIAVYAVAHIPKGRMETLGSIPVGCIFCMVTLWQGYFWFALFTHITMALSNEWFSLYYRKKQA